MTASSGQPPGRVADRAALPLVEGVARALFCAFIFFGCFTFLRPSPYDFLAIPAMAIWLLLGIRIHRASIPGVALLLIFQASMIVCLLPYLGEDDPTAYTIQSIYLTFTALFFMMFFSDDTLKRGELALRAYTASCVFAAAAGIYSYAIGSPYLFTSDFRAAGVFEDPNVLGSYLIPGFLYCVQGLLTGRARHPVLRVGIVALILTGIFLSFSRGSWGATVVSLAMLVVFTWRDGNDQIRARIRRCIVFGGIALALAAAGAAATTDVAERFADRAQVTKSYDEGETGRFGNQLRSIPMLIERPMGFGPLRFRLTFGLEPHNSYIGGFANAGWLGGLAFIGLILTTSFVGLRLCLVASPFRRLADIVVPVTVTFFLQAMQIDIDHWRHVWLLVGMVWGLEAARISWRGGLASRVERSRPLALRRAAASQQPAMPPVPQGSA